ncbi:MAG: hypothetical protein ACUVRD_04305 [Bacteroidia bacterium]
MISAGGLVISWLQLLSPAMAYTKAFHQGFTSFLSDTQNYAWPERLLETFENLYNIEWSRHRWREITRLYLSQENQWDTLLSKVQRYGHTSTEKLQTLITLVSDTTSDLGALLAALSPPQALQNLEDYLLRDMIYLAGEAASSWLPRSAYVEASLRGYLKGWIALWVFFGFDESKETLNQKMQTLHAIGLLGYYALLEASAKYRQWLRRRPKN